ncbi:hypothetical protein [Streptomyces lydicus]|uniref:hypothetical protein n=1 Tax=Streptomyces lydicus TaxID=47763 RepID=UPI0037D7DDA0
MTWEELARRVYGYYSSENTLNARRAASKLFQIICIRYSETGRHAGAILRQTREESWIEDQTLRAQGQPRYAVNASKYRVPTSEDILIGFKRGLYDKTVHADVAKVAKLVNKRCGTSFDPSEVAWWRLGFEQRMDEERRDLFTQFRNAMTIILDEKRRREVEARMVTVDAFRVDPVEPPKRCPTCRQHIDAAAQPVWASQGGNATVVTQRRPLIAQAK